MGGAVGLAKHSTPEQLAVTAFSYLVAGDYRQKAAATGLTFTAAHVITASTYGIILVQINAAGTISTKVPSATQAYASAALALAAKPAVDSGNVEIGYIQIANNAGDWTANTDDLTDASDVTTATFTSSASIGRAVLGSDIAFADTSFGAATLSTTLTDIRGSEDDAIFVLYTTDGTGALLDAGLQITFRPYGINGDAAMIR